MPRGSSSAAARANPSRPALTRLIAAPPRHRPLRQHAAGQRQRSPVGDERVADTHKVDLAHQLVAQRDGEVVIRKSVEWAEAGFAGRRDHRVDATERLEQRLDRRLRAQVDAKIAAALADGDDFVAGGECGDNRLADRPARTDDDDTHACYPVPLNSARKWRNSRIHSLRVAEGSGSSTDDWSRFRSCHHSGQCRRTTSPSRASAWQVSRIGGGRSPAPG